MINQGTEVLLQFMLIPWSWAEFWNPLSDYTVLEILAIFSAPKQQDNQDVITCTVLQSFNKYIWSSAGRKTTMAAKLSYHNRNKYKAKIMRQQQLTDNPH